MIPGCREPSQCSALDSRGGLMDQDERLLVFQSQVTNVRSLRTAMRQVHRSINASLRTRNQTIVEAFTKIYALLFLCLGRG